MQKLHLPSLLLIILLGGFFPVHANDSDGLTSSELISKYALLFPGKISDDHGSLCEDFNNADIIFGEVSQVQQNDYIFMDNRCSDVKKRSVYAKTSKFNFIKHLDLTKFKFHYFYSNRYQIHIPASDITKASSCHMDLKNESQINFLKIKERCGIETLVVGDHCTICPANGGGFSKYEYTDDSLLEKNWVNIINYVYADANRDDYMDLILTIRPDGQYSSVNNTETIIVTSFSKGEFVNINLEKGN
jgi:hypothetical protein